MSDRATLNRAAVTRGINNTSDCTAHSTTRTVRTSAVRAVGVPMETIIKGADGTNAATYRKYYQKKIKTEVNQVNFG
ncbi:hypothetical protein ACOMHN_015636 [Nucella lapillus]